MGRGTLNIAGLQECIALGWVIHRAAVKGAAELPELGGHTPYAVLRSGNQSRTVRCTWEAMRWAQAYVAARDALEEEAA